MQKAWALPQEKLRTISITLLHLEELPELYC
jgi:hypothetical protein